MAHSIIASEVYLLGLFETWLLLIEIVILFVYIKSICVLKNVLYGVSFCLKQYAIYRVSLCLKQCAADVDLEDSLSENIAELSSDRSDTLVLTTSIYLFKSFYTLPFSLSQNGHFQH